MKVGLNGSAVLALAGLAGVGVLAFLLWRNPQWLNPLSDKNLATQASNALVSVVTGGAKNGGEDSAGGVAARVREWISGDDAAIENMKAGSKVKDAITPDNAPGGGIMDQGYVL